MGKQHYDLAVLGGGPGGYIAAIRAAQLGMSVVCVDDRKRLGGTCLNIGCIPSKALLNSTEKFWEAKEHFKPHGIVVDNLQIDLKAMMGQKEHAVQSLTDGITHLFRKHNIDHVRGKGRLSGNHHLEVKTPEKQSLTVKADHLILATGSVPVHLSNVSIDHERIVTSEGILSLSSIPEHLIIIGGGYIGLEMGSVWGRVGAKITCVELMDRLIPNMDSELAKELRKALEGQGFTFRLNMKVTGARMKEQQVTVTLQSPEGKDHEQITGSHVLVAVGRRPYTDDLGLEDAGVRLTKKGFIAVDRQFRTTAEGIYAIGDAACEPMLAHKAKDEALACVE